MNFQEPQASPRALQDNLRDLFTDILTQFLASKKQGKFCKVSAAPILVFANFFWANFPLKFCENVEIRLKNQNATQYISPLNIQRNF